MISRGESKRRRPSDKVIVRSGEGRSDAAEVEVGAAKMNRGGGKSDSLAMRETEKRD